MAKDDELLDDQLDDDDLLDFDLDDLSAEDIHQDLILGESDDDEIIELVDLVEKGEEAFGGTSEGLEFSAEGHPVEGQGELDLLDDDLSGTEETAAEEGISLTDDDLDLSDLSMDSDLDLGGLDETEEFAESEGGKVSGAQDTDPSLNSLIVDDDSLEDLLGEEGLEPSQSYESIETSLESEGAGDDSAPGNIPEESDLDLSETVQTPIPDIREDGLFSEEEASAPDLPEEPYDITEGEAAEEFSAPQKSDAAFLSEEIPAALSEAGIEAVVAGALEGAVERAVRDTLTEAVERVTREAVSEAAERVIRETLSGSAERVIREAVSEAAERVITEAINALKQSLDSETD